MYSAFHDAEDDIGNGAERRPYRSGAVPQCVEARIGGIGGRFRYLLGNFGCGVDHGLCRIAHPPDA